MVFQELSLEVCRGERLAIIGESGAGKSTLLHLLGGLDRPTSGEIYYEGRDLGSLDDQELADFRNRELAFVWQNPSLLPEFTAEENVAMPLLIRGMSREAATKIAAARLGEVGLSGRRSHRSGELSGGEQQRVALARALATEPKVLLADEPTGNLDFRTGEATISLLFDLHETHRLTSVFVTHNISFASRCDRVFEMKKGSLLQTSVIELQGIGVVQDATRLGGGTYV
jgi:lipoprotein-releasing system ATP-binding protein